MRDAVAVDIAFHTGVADKLDHACRLLRKAYRQGAKVVVAGDAAVLNRLDQALWSFEPLEFVPHVRVRRGDVVPPRLSRTPIWLADAGAAAPHHDVLVNLGPEMVEGYEQYARVIEIVSAEAEDTSAGRRRWRAYEAQGLPIAHPVKGTS
jgi:DNA polymerase-3 subunit chi